MQSGVVVGGRPTGRLIEPKVVISFAVVLVALAYLVVAGTRSSSVYYLTVSELKAQGAARGGAVRVAGTVEPGSIRRSAGNTQVEFTVKDANGTLPVVYRGVVPDIFGDNIEVVVEGSYADGTFRATTMLAKCPSRFETKLPEPAS